MQKELKNKYQFYKSLVEIDKTFSDNKEFVKEVKKDYLECKDMVSNFTRQVKNFKKKFRPASSY